MWNKLIGHFGEAKKGLNSLSKRYKFSLIKNLSDHT
jgi:hypothetical protein